MPYLETAFACSVVAQRPGPFAGVEAEPEEEVVVAVAGTLVEVAVAFGWCPSGRTAHGVEQLPPHWYFAGQELESV